ncbi:unnamed protein product [Caenorhabditis auriculariae]|uniref:AAA+ ATPase domain-containing protein n=1 Tax=Caenorhabditis auriculariae TaxID=2777116 RepID=A0A8S1HQ10_9PELO|nr:unnamed protein product [Caenorhabditis auriculariae]
MDIRSFFGNGGGSKSSSNAPSSSKKEPTPKKRSSKKKDEIFEIEELSDGEDPLPKSMRGAQRKRNRIVVESDGSDDGFVRKTSSKPKENTKKEKTPVKSAPKKARVVISSDSDVTPVKEKPKNKSKRSPSPIEIDDDDDIEVLSDDEEVEKHVKGKHKKKLLPGQKRLDFEKNAPSTSGKEAPKPRQQYNFVNPSDFFQTSAKKSEKKTQEKEKEAVTEVAKQPEKRKTPTPKTPTPKKISPSQKENIGDDEFFDSDDDFNAPIIKKKKTPSPRKAPVVEEKKKKEEEKTKNTEKRNQKDTSKSPAKKLVEAAKVQKESSKSPLKRSDRQEKVQKELSKSPVKKPVDMASNSSANRQPPKVIDPNDLPWVDKYKPKSISQLVGQHGDKSPLNKLLDWLNDWAKLNLGEGAKVKRAKPVAWMAQQDGTAFKAVLLSGTPGVGKTTCAYMACESLGLKVVEMNASDVRSKKHLEAKVGELSGCHQIEEFFGKKPPQPQDNLKVHHVLIMDEVDGMSGNEDRAGIAELIQIIKDSKIPIICICNDRMHPKIRSLAGHCYDLRFHKPRVEQIRARMMTIAAQEKVKISKDELDEMIEMSSHDVRQTIYNLQMRSKSSAFGANKKDVTLGPFEAARKLLDQQSTLKERNEMFFVDYGIMPLFVQENYINMKNDKHTPLQAIRGMREASNCISMGDIVEKNIRSRGAWKLLNEQSMLACAIPSIATGGNLRGMLQFPTWLGRNSTAGKRKRMLTQLVMHTHLKVSADSVSFAMDYAPMLRERMTKPLLKHESEGIPAVLETMREYDLIRDDGEALGEIAVWPGKIDPASKILSKVKAALTRTLNKEQRTLPYSLADIAKGKKKAAAAGLDDEEGLFGDYADDEDAEEEEDSALGPEIVIKTTADKGKASRGRGGAASAGRGARGGGRGRGAKK